MKFAIAIVSLCMAAVVHLATAQPACQSVTPSNGQLWPPNGKFENITIVGVAADQTVVITGVKQDEDPGAGPQRGGRAKPFRDALKKLFKRNKGTAANTTETEEAAGPAGAPDAIVDGGVAMIRHERLGGGDGRVYHIYFNATNSTTKEVICTGEVTVCVPKSKGNGGGDKEQGGGKDKGKPTDTGLACVDNSLSGGTLYDSLAATSTRMLRA